MIITRKIQITISEKDKQLKEEYFKRIYETRDIAVKGANFVSSHLYMQSQIIPYIKDSENLEYIGAKGTPIKKCSTTYAELSYLFKGKVDMNMLSCLNQNVSKCFSDDCKKGLLYGKMALRSYKSNMPIPFKADQFINIHFFKEVKEDKVYNNCYFTLIGIPFVMVFGRDKSNNKSIVERVINGEYKMSTSSIIVDDKAKKMYLALCVDIPIKNNTPIKGKTLYAYLGILNPITYVVNKKLDESDYKAYEIGTKEEFNYRRRQIQEAVKRCQIENKYKSGGKGRKRKCQAIDRFKDKEKNYVDTKLHLYSKLLIDAAIKNRCDTIYLMLQKEREDKAKDEKDKGDDFVLRNWSYFGLKDKIKYKAKMNNISLEEEKQKV